MTNLILLSVDKDLKKFVKLALEGLPIKIVAEVGHLKEAMEGLQKLSAKIVIVDLFLAENSGLDAVKMLKKMDESLVAILLSRMRGRGTLERAFRHGANDVLVYPMPVEQLRQTLLHRLDRMKNDGLYVFHQ